MAITEFQRDICKLIASSRKAQGESYVAGGVALNELIQSPRISRDIDIFHDLAEAVLKTWESDRDLLTQNRYSVEAVRIRPGFAEAVVRKANRSVLMQWAADSAYRFFPLVEDEIFGLTLHPFDLATNKVLAMAGRLEARDWIDVIYCHQQVQNYGYLVWAACSKDPGFSPASLVNESRRSSHYSAAEISQLSFSGPPPDVAELSRQWHGMLKEAVEIIEILPAEQTGTCVLDREANLFRGGPALLKEALSEKSLRFHAGMIGGAFPKFLDR
jgi:hypothetical protein